MNNGSALACHKKAKRGPSHGRRVRFDVPAYVGDFSRCAAYYHNPPAVPLHHPAQAEWHSITMAYDYVDPFAAHRRAIDLHFECIDCNAQTILDAQCPCLPPHVLDLWCAEDNDIGDNKPSDTPEEDLAGYHPFVHLEWQALRPTPASSCQPETPVARNDAVMVALSPWCSSGASLTLRTYGYFGRDAGQRDVQLPCDDLPHWKDFIDDAWYDFVRPGGCKVTILQPQPEDPGIHLHLIVTMDGTDEVLILLETSVDSLPSTRTVVECHLPMTGYAIVSKMDQPIHFDMNYHFWQHGAHHYGSEILPTANGQFWTISILSPTGALHLQQLSARLVPSTPVVPRSSRLWPEPNEDYMRIYRENEAEDFLEEEQLIVGPVTIFDHDEWIRIANELDQATGTQITILVYGLKDVGIGMRRLTLTSLNLGVLEEAILGLWPHFDALAKKVHLVYPQPIQNEGNQIAVILEFYDLWNPRDEFWKPILHECLQPELDTIERTACYSPEQVTKEVFPIPHDLCPTANSERELHVWVRGHPLLPYIERAVIEGDLVSIRYMSPRTPIEDWIKRFFPGADDFKRVMIERTAYHEMTPTTWTFLGEVSPGEPACLDVHHPQWLRFHDPYFVVQAFLEIVTNRGLRYNNKTIYVTPSRNDKNVTFVFGSPQMNQALVQVGFSAKWDEVWSERFCYAVQGNQTMEAFLRHVNVYNFVVSVFQDGRLLNSDHIHLTNGDSIEIEIQDDPEDHDASEDDSDSMSLMQSPSTSTPHSGDVSLTLRGTHGLLHTVQISVDQSLYAYLDEHWPFPSHQPTDLAALHAVSAPPSYVRPESEQIFLVELSSDRFDQVHPDDVLLLLTVRYFVSGSAWTSDKVKTRVLWGPKKATREQALQFLRMQWHCRSEATTCELLFNEVVWAIHDTALYNFESGDHLRLNIKSTRDNWCEFTFSEQADRERRVLESSPSSPPVEQGGPESEEADLSPYTIQNQQLSRSRSRSLLQSTTQIVPKNSQSPGAPFLQCRPNADITDMMDFDDYIPYDRQFPNGDHFSGRVVAPFQWSDHPFFQAASDHGAVHRDPHRHLYVNCRTWFVTHTGPAVHQHRDLTIRAQLLIHIVERVRHLWQDLLSPTDTLRVYLVNPTPAVSRHEEPRVQILVECNRPTDSDIRPILMSFQQISVIGLAEHLLWRPLLSPPALTLDFLQQASLTGCLSHHFLVPIAARARGWLQQGQQRHTTPGAYIPAWYDLRRPDNANLAQVPPTDDDDAVQLMQMNAQSLSGKVNGAPQESVCPHVNDLWCGQSSLVVCPPHQNDDSKPTVLSLHHLIPTPPEIFVPCSPLHFLRSQLLHTDLGPPGGRAQVVKWHSATLQAFEETPDWQDELPLSYELYTDGSSAFLDETRQGAAAVVLIVNTTQGPRFGGSHSFTVDAPGTAPLAEITAMFGAILWAVSLAEQHATSTPQIELCFDCALAGKAASGHWSPKCHSELQSIIRSLCHWIQRRHGTSTISWRHVPSHTGHPWNEAADALSWAAVAAWIPTQSLTDIAANTLLTATHPDLHQWLWLLEDALCGRPGAPRVDLQGFHFRLDQPFALQPSPDMHPLTLRQQREAPQGARTLSMFNLRCGTANVLTLQSGSLGARAEHLAAQFHQADLHCIGLQETRSYVSGHQLLGHYHVLSSPAVKGVGGVQCWIAQTWHSDPSNIEIKSTDLRILSATSQRMIVRVQNPTLKLLFIVAHAPSDGNLDTYRQFWKSTTGAIPHCYQSWKQIHLIDANARIGSVTSHQVGSAGAEEENPAGDIFHQWLTDQDLLAPQTFPFHHSGHHYTWTHSKGEHKARLDFILVNRTLYSEQIKTWVSDEVDLSLDRADHECVCASIPLAVGTRTNQPRHLGAPEIHDDSIDVPSINWSTDVHSHAAQLQKWLIATAPPRAPAVPRKKHLTDNTWQLIQLKKYHSKRLKACRSTFDKHILLAVFNGWKHSSQSSSTSSNANQVAASFTSWLKLCDHSIAFHSALFRRLSRQTTRQVRQDDKTFYQQLAYQHGRIAADEGLPSLWKSIRHLLPKFKKKQRSNIRCIGPEPHELRDHYNSLEAGYELDYASLLRQCFDRQKEAIADAPLQMELSELPSRQEIEQVGRAQKRGRAPGVDGIIPEILHQAVPWNSDVFTLLFLKTWVLSAEPVQFKGGLMHSIAKKRGSHTAQGMRGIVLLDTVGKLYHGLLRRRLIASIPPLHFQLGGYRGQQTLFATQLLRSYSQLTTSLRISTATVFIDVKSAFHCLLREHAFGIDSTFPRKLIDTLRHEGLNIEALTTDIHVHAAHFLDQVSPGLARATQDAHQNTWYVLPHSDMCFTTTRGSRPGSPLADIAFNILMNSLLKDLMTLIEEHDVHEGIWDKLCLPSPVVAWMDDVAFPISTLEAPQLDSALECLLPRVRDIFEAYGLRLNLAKGKTEVVCQYRGAGSPACREFRFIERLGTFRVADLSWMAVSAYEHLGTMFAQSVTIQTELRTRSGKATTAFREMSRNIFTNRHIPVATRLQLLESLVLPVLLHGCGNWPLLAERQFRKLNHQILKWQRTIANDGFWSEDQTSDWEFQSRWKLVPLALRLAKHRILYAFKLFSNAPSLVLDYITAEDSRCAGSWMTALRRSINWLNPRWRPTPRGAPPTDPPEDICTTADTLKWLQEHCQDGAKRMRQAIHRFLQEEHMMEMIHAGHRRLLDYCATFVSLVEPSPALTASAGHAHFPCGLCPKVFSSVQARQGHHWKFHGHFSEERKFVHTAVCSACGQCFWTAQRMQQHLRYSRKFGQQGCLAQLKAYFEPLSAPSEIEIPQPLQGYHRLPKCLTAGPHTKPDYPVWKRRVLSQLQQWRRDWEDHGLTLFPDQQHHQRVQQSLDTATLAWCASLPSHYTFEGTDGDLEDQWALILQPWLHQQEKQTLWALVEWGSANLYALQDQLEHEEVKQALEATFLSIVELLPIWSLLGRRQQLQHWLQHEPQTDLGNAPEPVQDSRVVRPLEPIPNSLQQQTEILAPQLGRILRDTPAVRRGVPIVLEPDGAKCIYVLHLFSGRRREYDCHHWAQQLGERLFPSFKIRLFSVDTAINEEMGNLAKSANFELVLKLAQKGLFALCISGPPCETWSAARHLEIEGAKYAPRPLRSNVRPWGLSGLSMRELHQLEMGSHLMLNNLLLETTVVLAGGGAIMVHPAPHQCEDYVSIWRVALHSQVSMQLFCAQQLVIEQWKYGAAGVKPTTLRYANLGRSMASILHGATVAGLTRPKVLLAGLDASNKFKTAAAKEYPSGLCKALLLTGLTGLQSRRSEGFQEAQFSQLGERERKWLHDMSVLGACVDAQSTFLPDYQPASG